MRMLLFLHHIMLLIMRTKMLEIYKNNNFIVTLCLIQCDFNNTYKMH